jgi:hypothetical protein
VDEAEDAHAVNKDDRAAEPAAEGEEAEADQRQHEGSGADVSVFVACVAEDGHEREEDGRGEGVDPDRCVGQSAVSTDFYLRLPCF